MIDAQGKVLCELLKLGDLIAPLRKLTSTSLHNIWSMQTARGEYAIKALSPNIAFNENRRQKYEITENIARAFAQRGIPTTSSIRLNNKSLLEIGGMFFIVYPWIEGVSFEKKLLSPIHAEKIAIMIAKIHQLDLSFPELGKPKWFIHSNQDIQIAADNATREDLPFVKKLHDSLNTIYHCNEKYQQSIEALNKHLLVSHGDFHQKNFLLQNNNEIFLIDWSSAGLLNPTQELISTALNLSGVASLALNIEIFKIILSTYQKNTSKLQNDIISAFYGDLGNWLDWLTYHLIYSLKENSPEEATRRIHIEKVNKALRVIDYIAKNMFAWIELC